MKYEVGCTNATILNNEVDNTSLNNTLIYKTAGGSTSVTFYLTNDANTKPTLSLSIVTITCKRIYISV